MGHNDAVKLRRRPEAKCKKVLRLKATLAATSPRRQLQQHVMRFHYIHSYLSYTYTLDNLNTHKTYHTALP
jgi:hypothetical protein